jgi:putative transposase
VTRVLERAIAERGRPEQVRSENGPEFIAALTGWAEAWKIGLVHIDPGKPMQNGQVERFFNGRLRDECLDTSWFRTLNEVRQTLADWRREYNCERPHSSLDYRTPEGFRHQTG